MAIDGSDTDLLTGNDKIVAEAKARFNSCESWESRARQGFLDDVKFANADSLNGWQWPNEIRRNRDIDERPVLTVNKTHQHCLQIINEARQNPAAIKIVATGNGSTYESAQILEGVCRRIEYISNAQSAYEKAIEFQVYGGIGYWRVVTDYAGDDSFDQEIYIRRIKDPLNVYIDPDINELDGSDARYGFLFDDMPKDEFKAKYPKYAYIAGKAVLGNTDNWMGKDYVRIVEYYRAIEEKRVLVAFTDPTTQETQVLFKDEIPKALWELLKEYPSTKTRDVTETKIEWYLIAGDEVISKSDWPGKYIPIVRVIGEEIIVEGEIDRKGHTRALRDPQRIYNYWTSSAVENVALQSKIPYIGAIKAIEGFETYWETANRTNYSILPYNHIDDEGNPLAAPMRQQPPTMASAYIQGMQISANEMMMVSGQYQAVMGQQSNETSGKAIDARQRQGENSTYHFIANQGHAIRYTGKIIIDLIPKIYDTKRIMKIMAEDGSQSDITLDPKANMAYQQQMNRMTQEVQHIFNPNVGKYSVEADVGPAYGTRRQEAFNAFERIVTQNPGLTTVVGDLMFKYADFPGADNIANRLKNMVPPQALGNGASPEFQHLQMQLQNMQKITATLMDDLAASKLALKDKSEIREVDEYKAITDRLKVMIPMMINPKDIAQQVMDLMQLEKQNSHALNMQSNEHDHQTNLQSQAQEATNQNAGPQGS